MKLPLMPILGLDDSMIDTSNVFSLDVEADPQLYEKIYKKELDHHMKYGKKPHALVLGRHTYLQLIATMQDHLRNKAGSWKMKEFLGYPIRVIMEPSCCFFEISPDDLMSTISIDQQT